jgi:hypothetical protein
MAPLSEEELDYGYSEGFLKTWLEKAPKQVREHLDILVSGITYYRKKVADIEQDLFASNARYNALTAQAATYLEFMSQQRELLDQTLIDNQRDSHRQEPQI